MKKVREAWSGGWVPDQPHWRASVRDDDRGEIGAGRRFAGPTAPQPFAARPPIPAVIPDRAAAGGTEPGPMQRRAPAATVREIAG